MCSKQHPVAAGLSAGSQQTEDLGFTQDGHVGSCQGTLERHERWSGLREGWRPGGHQGSLGAQCEEQPRQPHSGSCGSNL